MQALRERLVLREVGVLGIVEIVVDARRETCRLAFDVAAQFRIRIVAAEGERAGEASTPLQLNRLVLAAEIRCTVLDDALIDVHETVSGLWADERADRLGPLRDAETLVSRAKATNTRIDWMRPGNMQLVISASR